MRRNVLSLIGLLCFLLSTAGFSADNANDPVLKSRQYAFDQAKKLGKGINMGNALDAPTEKAWGNPIRDDYFRLMKAAGFETVRIPVRWSAHALTDKPYTIDSDFMNRVDAVISNALASKLIVVLNIHHYLEIHDAPETHKERFLALWKQIAEHYRNLPESVYFELLNEPTANFIIEKWQVMAADALHVVRNSNPKRIVVIGGNSWNNLASLFTMNFPDNDPNLIFTFHLYDPQIFTHQQAEWVSGMNGISNIVWPHAGPSSISYPPSTPEWIRYQMDQYNKNPADSNPCGSNEISMKMEQAAIWVEDNKRPLWLGEFGSIVFADNDSRARYTGFVRHEAERNNIPWAYWEFSAYHFGLFDPVSNTWNTGLSNALLGK